MSNFVILRVFIICLSYEIIVCSVEYGIYKQEEDVSVQKEFIFVTEDERETVVEYKVTETPCPSGKSYGIAAAIKSEGKISEYEEVCNVFFTYEEAEKVTDMLCRYGVTPCALRDVIRDLL